jgi:hypothetical protein
MPLQQRQEIAKRCFRDAQAKERRRSRRKRPPGRPAAFNTMVAWLRAEAKAKITKDALGFSHAWRLIRAEHGCNYFRESTFLSDGIKRPRLYGLSLLHLEVVSSAEGVAPPHCSKHFATFVAVSCPTQREGPLHRTTKIMKINIRPVPPMMHNEPADASGGPSCAFVCDLAPQRPQPLGARPGQEALGTQRKPLGVAQHCQGWANAEA